MGEAPCKREFCPDCERIVVIEGRTCPECQRLLVDG